MHYENDSFQVDASKEAGCLLTLKITVLPVAAKKAYKQAIKKINKEISVPGFRKGKAPEDAVITKYAAHIEQEWKEILINDAFRAGCELTSIYPLSKETIQKPKLEKCSQEEGAVVSLSYEYYPEVPEIDFSSISLPHLEQRPVDGTRLHEILQEIRKAHAEYDEVQERGVEEGDYVDLSIDATNEEPPKPIVKERRFEVASTRMPEWLKKGLLNLKKGESVDSETEVDENADPRSKEQFKPTPVRITLHAIWQIRLPELSDELAKKAGADSLVDLEQKITANLEAEALEELKEQRLRNLEEALLQKYPFDLPRSVVQKEIDWRKGRRPEGSSDDLQAEAEKSLRLYFLEKKIQSQGKIEISNQELNEELISAIRRQPHLYGREMDAETSRNLVNRLASDLLTRKTKQYALEQVLNKV